jgi:hypothetical protein
LTLDITPFTMEPMSAATVPGIATLRGAKAAQVVKQFHLKNFRSVSARAGRGRAAGTAPKEPLVVAVAVEDPTEAAELTDLLLFL